MEKDHRSIAVWLFTVSGLIFIMALIGAITRLTESGLSMVEWRPLIGTLPPLNEQEWVRVFELYRVTPEYIHKNAGMSLAQFKEIFFWEWFHRLFGRVIGLAYAVPFFYFLFRRKIPSGKIGALFGILCLGGLQGVVGWYMVKSGLIDQPTVSHYRLSLHLGMAFLVYILCFWYGLVFWGVSKIETTVSKPMIWGCLGVVALTIIWGVFVAGTDAGMIYNDFPWMGDQTLLPSDWAFLTPTWLNFIENPATIQFTHRWLGIGTLFVLIILWAQCTHNSQVKQIRTIGWGILLASVAQVCIGIVTLVSQVYISAAVLHQGGALILLSLLVFLLYRHKPV